MGFDAKQGGRLPAQKSSMVPRVKEGDKKAAKEVVKKAAEKVIRSPSEADNERIRLFEELLGGLTDREILLLHGIIINRGKGEQ